MGDRQAGRPTVRQTDREGGKEGGTNKGRLMIRLFWLGPAVYSNGGCTFLRVDHMTAETREAHESEPPLLGSNNRLDQTRRAGGRL